MVDLLSLHWEILIGLGVPAATGMVFWARKEWHKSICFKLMKARLDGLEAEAAEGKLEHKELRSGMRDIHGRQNEIDKNVHRIMGHLGIE